MTSKMLVIVVGHEGLEPPTPCESWKSVVSAAVYCCRYLPCFKGLFSASVQHSMRPLFSLAVNLAVNPMKPYSRLSFDLEVSHMIPELRVWQKEALCNWLPAKQGIAKVVTGAGKDAGVVDHDVEAAEWLAGHRFSLWCAGCVNASTEDGIICALNPGRFGAT